MAGFIELSVACYWRFLRQGGAIIADQLLSRHFRCHMLFLARGNYYLLYLLYIIILVVYKPQDAGEDIIT